MELEGFDVFYEKVTKEKDCDAVSTIKDVNDQWEYKDEFPGGKHDKEIVSCGQKENYNELKDKFEKYYSEYSESEIAEAMCKCCIKLKYGNPSKQVSWDDFYSCMEKQGYSKS